MDPPKRRKKWLSFLRDLLILVLIGNVLALVTVPMEVWSVEVFLQNCMFSVGIGYPAMRGMIYISIVLERKFPWLESPLKRLIYQVVSMTLFSALIILIGFGLWFEVVAKIGIRENLPYILPVLKVVYIFIFLSMLVGNTVLFFKNWKRATIQKEELKRAHLALQNQSLRDQMKPHFLFNSLSSLVTLINTNQEKATQFVHKLSDVYRYVLDQQQNELVALEEELAFLENYVYLQRFRFGEHLRVRLLVGEVRGVLVIPLSLQMLVENAIKHNEISANRPLEIEIASIEGRYITVKNNLNKKELMEHTSGMGLENLRKQIRFFSDDPIVVEQEGGFFIVRIPTFQSGDLP